MDITDYPTPHHADADTSPPRTLQDKHDLTDQTTHGMLPRLLQLASLEGAEPHTQVAISIPTELVTDLVLDVLRKGDPTQQDQIIRASVVFAHDIPLDYGSLPWLLLQQYPDDASMQACQERAEAIWFMENTFAVEDAESCSDVMAKMKDASRKQLRHIRMYKAMPTTPSQELKHYHEMAAALKNVRRWLHADCRVEIAVMGRAAKREPTWTTDPEALFHKLRGDKGLWSKNQKDKSPQSKEKARGMPANEADRHPPRGGRAKHRNKKRKRNVLSSEDGRRHDHDTGSDGDEANLGGGEDSDPEVEQESVSGRQAASDPVSAGITPGGEEDVDESGDPYLGLG
ncbi:hypothetical protein B0A50_06438 [Salinomyces thailandicus]|uniref:Uncharacterized protein n=1 Tax=Salinomyces thailandicus TaxID=706561 RepID=A0A4U0TQ37_9PEZI|nr:hypothetical protein B0A50_06438 [Salinomyces thailandica]